MVYGTEGLDDCLGSASSKWWWWQNYFRYLWLICQVNMATKQEVTAEEELTVKTQARAPSTGVVLQNPPPLGATPDVPVVVAMDGQAWLDEIPL